MTPDLVFRSLTQKQMPHPQGPLELDFAATLILRHHYELLYVPGYMCTIPLGLLSGPLLIIPVCTLDVCTVINLFLYIAYNINIL